MTKRKKDKTLNYLIGTGITVSILGLYCYGKGIKIQDIFTNMFVKQQDNSIDYNDASVHAPIDYYLDNDESIKVNSDGIIKVGVWSAVKEALNNIFKR